MIYSNVPRSIIRMTKLAISDANSEMVDLQVLTNRILPFQFRRARRMDLITTFKLVHARGLSEVDLTGYVDAADWPYIVSMPAYDYIIFKGNELTSDLPGGRYYYEISDGVETWYSMAIINVPCWTAETPVPIPSSYDDAEIDTNEILN